MAAVEWKRITAGLYRSADGRFGIERHGPLWECQAPRCVFKTERRDDAVDHQEAEGHRSWIIEPIGWFTTSRELGEGMYLNGGEGFDTLRYCEVGGRDV